GEVAVRRDDAEPVQVAGIQQVHGVDDHGRVGGVFAGGVAVLLHRDDGIVQKRIFPAFQPDVAPVAVDALAGRHAEGGGLVHDDLDILGRNVVRVDQYGKFQVFHLRPPFSAGRARAVAFWSSAPDFPPRGWKYIYS